MNPSLGNRRLCRLFFNLWMSLWPQQLPPARPAAQLLLWVHPEAQTGWLVHPRHSVVGCLDRENTVKRVNKPEQSLSLRRELPTRLLGCFSFLHQPSLCLLSKEACVYSVKRALCEWDRKERKPRRQTFQTKVFLTEGILGDRELVLGWPGGWDQGAGAAERGQGQSSADLQASLCWTFLWDGWWVYF